jgi:putative holliday junction resolvase
MSRLLGLDPGTRRCGVAVSDSDRRLVFPRPALPADETFLAALRKVLEEERIVGIVIGRPVSLSGSPTQSTALSDSLLAAISNEFPQMLVEQWDERLTTVEAERALRMAGHSQKDQKKIIDSAAATVMLQSYCDAQRVD